MNLLRRPESGVCIPFVVAFAIVILSVWPARADRNRFFRASFAGVCGVGGKSITNRHGQTAMDSLQLEWLVPYSSRTEIMLSAGPSWFDQPKSWFGNRYNNGNETVRAVAAGVRIRRYFGLERSSRPYLDFGIGPVWAESRVPAATSHFNLSSEFGAGLALRPDGRFPLIVGYRFSHLSNGGYSPRNPGWNVSSLVIGTRIRPFEKRAARRAAPAR